MGEARQENLRYALHCAELGLYVFPCGADKKPLVKWRALSTVDPEQIKQWWTEYPDALPGIDLAKSDHIVIDGDRHGGPDGVIAVEKLFAEHATPLTDAPGVITPRGGGRHSWFKQPNGNPLGNRDKPIRDLGINIRGAGGYVIAPGATLPDGRRYTRDKDTPNLFVALRENAVPPLPEWFVELLRPKARHDQDREDAPQPAQKLNGSIRHHRYAEAALDRLCEELANTPERSRNIELNNAALRMGHMVASGWIDRAIVERRLAAAAMAAGLPFDEIRKTLASGLNAGMQEPQPELADRPRQSRHSNMSEQERQKFVDAVGILSEDKVAMVFAERHRDGLLYCHTTGKWHVWDTIRWKPNDTKLAFHYARELARELSQGISASISKVAFAAAVERFCVADPVFAVTAEKWDANPYLLGTPQGTIDLRTGQLRPASPGDYITKIAAVAPAAEEDCPVWLRFLDEVTQSDAAVIYFLKQWCGYNLTGEIIEHALAFLIGPGGNGKGTFLNQVTGIMADYTVTAAMETFTASKHDRHPTELAMLAGARMVTASESEEGRDWAEARVKQLTGGDLISARYMRQDFFTFAPTFKLTIIGNHMPNLRNVDDAMKRRLNRVPFNFKPTKVDTELGTKLRKEWPGILRWMINGCLAWQRDGLIPAPVIAEATKEYFEEQDVLSQWLDERCDVEPGNEFKTATHADLYASWRDYAKRMGEAEGTSKAFRETLKSRGIQRTRIGKNRSKGWKGIRLNIAQSAWNGN
jgi:putative DNA primase/helicase